MAVGTSLLVIAVNSGTALAARIGMGVGDLDWTLIAVFTAAAMAGSLLGGHITACANPQHLSRAFAALLIVVAPTQLPAACLPFFRTPLALAVEWTHTIR